MRARLPLIPIGLMLFTLGYFALVLLEFATRCAA